MTTIRINYDIKYHHTKIESEVKIEERGLHLSSCRVDVKQRGKDITAVATTASRPNAEVRYEKKHGHHGKFKKEHISSSDHVYKKLKSIIEDALSSEYIRR